MGTLLVSLISLCLLAGFAKGFGIPNPCQYLFPGRFECIPGGVCPSASHVAPPFPISCYDNNLVCCERTVDPDPCAGTTNCDANALCSNLPGGSYICTCNSGFTGDGFTCSDIDECAGTNNCDTNAQCFNVPGTYSCTCNSGFNGNGFTCTDIDECAGTNNCDTNAQCFNVPGTYSCTCNNGFNGNGFTCTDIDECAGTNNCDINAQCFNVPGTYSCTCNTGFNGNGFTCTDIDECAGTNNCDINAQCFNVPGTYSCTCNTGFNGNGFTCTDIDECAGTNNCDINAQCFNVPGTYSCTCNTGFNGDGFTCTDIDECAGTNNCDINAQCFNVPGTYSCTCNTGFNGNGFTCADINECSPISSCDANAQCQNSQGTFSCTCNPGFTGDGFTCAPVPTCGLELTNRILNGNSVSSTDSPWQATFVYPNGVPFGAGVIVSQTHIVTSAYVALACQSATCQVKVGDYNRNVPDPNEQTRTTIGWTVHPQALQSQTDFFTSPVTQQTRNNIGVVELDTPLNFGPGVNQPCPPVGVASGAPSVCKVAGFGLTVQNDATSNPDFLQVANIQRILDGGSCGSPLGQNSRCAVSDDTTVALCQGDEGAGVVCLGAGGFWSLEGIVSLSSFGCTNNIIPIADADALWSFVTAQI